MADKYVRDMNGAELRAHMKSLKAMRGWHDPLSDSLYAEILRMDAERAQHAGEAVAYELTYQNGEQELAYATVVERYPSRPGKEYTAVPLCYAAPQPAQVPEGWKLVPVERSYDMRTKAIIAHNVAVKSGADLDDALKAAWEAEVAAAPEVRQNGEGR